MKFALLLISICCTWRSMQGQFHYTITSTPDSAVVTMNGEEKCTTPCVVKYRWKDSMDDRIIFEVSTPGHRSWADTLTAKPHQFSQVATLDLERIRTRLDIDTAAPLIAFDKLLAADFEEGRPIGSYTDRLGKKETLKWEGAVKIGEQAFERKFYEVVSAMGFRISKASDPKLFTNTKNERPQMPRFVVGVKLVNYDITSVYDRRPYQGAGRIAGKTTLGLEWQVLDRSTGKVVLTQNTTGIHRYRHHYGPGGENLAAFEDALMKFIDQGELTELVKQSKGIYAVHSGPEALSAVPAIQLERPVVPEFKSLSELIKYADRSCVTVITDGGHGSGVIINSEGHFLTSYHVIDGVNKIEVQFSDGLKQEAKLLAFDLTNDVALLDITGSGYRPLPVAIGDAISMGDEVITIGTPADLLLGQSVARGILSGKRQFEDLVYLQTDMAVSPGNSGGPVINSKGEVVGLVQGKIVSAGVEGISFATPIGRVLEVLHIQAAE